MNLMSSIISNRALFQKPISKCECLTLQSGNLTWWFFNGVAKLLGFLCLMSLWTIFQLYPGGLLYWWRVPRENHWPATIYWQHIGSCKFYVIKANFCNIVISLRVQNEHHSFLNIVWKFKQQLSSTKKNTRKLIHHLNTTFNNISV
jgi:hypothetical protein